MAEPQTRPRPERRERVRTPIGAGARREMVRNRLIESRLTPNAISVTGLILNVVAAVFAAHHDEVAAAATVVAVLASLMVS